MWIDEAGRICKEYAYALSGTAYWNEEAGDWWFVDALQGRMSIELKSAQISAANERRRQAEM